MNGSQRIIHDDGTLRAIAPPPSRLHLLQERADESTQRFIETMRKLRTQQAVEHGEFERFNDGREVS